MECTCYKCTAACHNRPGWFRPGEVAKAAALMGMSEKAFFDMFVSVDYYVDGDKFLFVLAPATVNTKPGDVYPFDPHGKCRLLEQGLCDIHEAKPFECAFYDHTKPYDVLEKRRFELVLEWQDHQDEIERLLGRKPEVEIPDSLEQLTFLTDTLLRGM